jgi:hypothetical protein
MGFVAQVKVLSDNEFLDDLQIDDSVSQKADSNTLTFLAWIRVQKGEQLKNHDLVSVAKVLGKTAQRDLANGNTKSFNDIGRKATLAIYRHLASGSRVLINPTDITSLEAMLKTAKVAAKAAADAEIAAAKANK